jgi:ATP-binding cassette, subfamily B, bacterial PglK
MALRDSFKKIFEMLGDRERTQFYWLIALTITMGILDVMGVASIMPFLAVVANPEVIETNAILNTFYRISGTQDVQSFLIVLAAAMFLFVLGTTLFRALTFYALTYFTQMRTLSLATRLMEHYLSQPYVWFLTRHSSDLGKTILSEVSQVVNGPLSATLRLIANSILILFLVIFLLVLEPRAAIGAAVLFGGSYGLIYIIVGARLSRMGRERVDANRAKFQVMQEAMGGIKNVKLLNLERSYIDRFKKPAGTLARNQASLAVISELPRNLLEVIAFGGMILFVLWLLATRDGGVAGIIPLLGVYAFAAARMFPTIQQFFASLSAIRFGKPALDQLHEELTGPPPYDMQQGSQLRAIPLRDTLELKNVRFAFPGAEQPALCDLSMTVAANTTIGIVGATGAGKTTAVDVILGLLTPQSGTMKVDGQVIDEDNVRAWQKSVGYVPQDIFLTDDTVAANIAFGKRPEDIDMDAVENAARTAELHDFVMAKLPDGYATKVGERGTRLSGGQRQRIGIARALYSNPDILIFDEATSALDNLTERAVMEAITHLSHKKTIIVIAHRLSTVRNCDRIFLLEDGAIAGADAYDQLVETNKMFRALHEATG